jgi:alkyldihydroxyacetonephosphate synthase
MIGSEGTLGVITRAWMRVQPRPRFRASVSVCFPGMAQACEVVRGISQSALYPSNCRLLDPVEARMNSVGEGDTALVVLAFESADHPLDAWMGRSLELAGDHAGSWDRAAVARSLHSGDEPGGEGEHRKAAAGAWRNRFLRAPITATR